VIWRSDEHEPLGDQAWDETRAVDAIRTIVADAEAAADGWLWPGHPLDDLAEDEGLSGLYLGSGGMVWGLWKLGSGLDAAVAIAAALERYRAAPDFGAEAHAPSLLMGEAGLLAVAERVGSPASDRTRLRALIRANRAHPTWELMWGSPGTMLAARACGLDEEWRDSARLLWERWDASGVWTQDLYQQTTRYLGPVHGFAGNVHALRGYVDAEALRTRVSELLMRTALSEDGFVNWPPLADPVPDLEQRLRVQWCHGAPGIVATLGDLIDPDTASAAGELIWHAGPLHKGPGLCHGTAGNGYAFLRLHGLTGETRWLERARRFAMHAVEQVDRVRAEYGRGRFSLFTGDVGVALFVRACLEPPAAAFPILDEL
jgi:Lanthionine synthetase C-like protein